MIKELLLATVLSTSFSVRTPNDTTKPLDYEFSVKSENNEGKFKYNIKRDWERELGEKYIDDIANFSHNPYDAFYYGIDYINKESKNIFYTTYNFGLQHPSGFKVGLSLKDDAKLFNAGFNKKFKKDDLEYLMVISVKTDLEENQIFNIKSEVKKWFTEKVNIFGLYKHEYYNEREDFQFKVGIGVKL
jgi:hypothetical protein